MKNNILPLPFNSPRVPAEKRIGPHNFIILSIIIGSLSIVPVVVYSNADLLKTTILKDNKKKQVYTVGLIY